MTLVYGLITGIVFGFLLQKASVIRYDKQLGALRLKDLTIVKFMLSTILVAMVGTYLLKDLGLVKLSIKNDNFRRRHPRKSDLWNWLGAFGLLSWNFCRGAG